MMPGMVEASLGRGSFEIGLKGLQERRHLFFDLLCRDDGIFFGRDGIAKTSGDTAYPGMRRAQIRSQRSILVQNTVHLRGQAAQVGSFGFILRNLMQDIGDRLHLLIALQASPIERFATAAIHCIPDGSAHLLFQSNQDFVSPSWQKGGDSSLSAASLGSVSKGTAAKLPRSCFIHPRSFVSSFRTASARLDSICT